MNEVAKSLAVIPLRFIGIYLTLWCAAKLGFVWDRYVEHPWGTFFLVFFLIEGLALTLYPSKALGVDKKE
jgi:hypothetical protein